MSIAEPATIEPTPPADEVVGSPAPRKRRKWPWIVLAIVLVLALLQFAIVWYISGTVGSQAMIVTDPPIPVLTITKVTPTEVTYTGTFNSVAADEGLLGIKAVAGGFAETGFKMTTEGTSFTRTIEKQQVQPQFIPGDEASLDKYYFPENPMVGLNIPFLDVNYTSPGGPTHAWFVPGNGDQTKWVIYTHGKGALTAEGLRILQTVHELGYPTLMINYLNDTGAPQGNNEGQFGAQEWPYLQGAVAYALEKGATSVVLTAASMGGAITEAFLLNSPLKDKVLGQFLDAPAVSFNQIVDSGAADMHVPQFITDMGKWMATQRYGFDFNATNYINNAKQITVPTLIVQGTDDHTVPLLQNQQFVAAANPGVMTLETFPGAQHVQSWNMDRPRYISLLSTFVERVAPNGKTLSAEFIAANPK